MNIIKRYFNLIICCFSIVIPAFAMERPIPSGLWLIAKDDQKFFVSRQGALQTEALESFFDLRAPIDCSQGIELSVPFPAKTLSFVCDALNEMGNINFPLKRLALISSNSKLLDEKEYIEKSYKEALDYPFISRFGVQSKFKMDERTNYSFSGYPFLERDDNSCDEIVECIDYLCASFCNAKNYDSDVLRSYLRVRRGCIALLEFNLRKLRYFNSEYCFIRTVCETILNSNQLSNNYLALLSFNLRKELTEYMPNALFCKYKGR